MAFQGCQEIKVRILTPDHLILKPEMVREIALFQGRLITMNFQEDSIYVV